LVAECGAHVRVLVRSLARAAPLSRFPVEVAVGDLRTPVQVQAATAGCEVVVNCAKATDGTPAARRALETAGIRNLLEASLRAGVARVVHVSTMVVYELPATGELDESAPGRRSRDLYADSKRAGEQIALEYARRLPVVVIQPTVVYGPRAGVYGRDIFEELRTSRVPLVDGGEGTCNALFVDDLVTALLLAATSDRAPGETFLVSGPEHPTWSDFFGAFERMLGVHRLVPMSAAEAIARWRAERKWLLPEAIRAIRHDKQLRTRLLATREGVVVRRMAERLMPESFFAPERWVDAGAGPRAAQAELPLATIRPEVVRFLASRALVHSTKARDLLGYRPVFGLEEGMRLTESWARWEGLLDGGGAVAGDA
jgi:nucleoside-diphosphate-sugar epimerase